MRNCPEPQRHNDNSSKIKRNNFNTCRNVRRHLQSSFSALKLLKLFHYFNLVSLKDSLITGFQGNTASKPVQFVRTLCEHISSLQPTMAFQNLPVLQEFCIREKICFVWWKIRSFINACANCQCFKSWWKIHSSFVEAVLVLVQCVLLIWIADFSPRDGPFYSG